ncbi:hypothetical protein ABEB36_002324 [Hypothenemus hampei]|uniref:Uncharacterized protein n=1 Tax=Hypothenemus hampei TaxID=57062 RepID=A0ABD1F705_HYPHA
MGNGAEDKTAGEFPAWGNTIFGQISTPLARNATWMETASGVVMATTSRRHDDIQKHFACNKGAGLIASLIMFWPLSLREKSRNKCVELFAIFTPTQTHILEILDDNATEAVLNKRERDGGSDIGFHPDVQRGI